MQHNVLITHGDPIRDYFVALLPSLIKIAIDINYVRFT